MAVTTTMQRVAARRLVSIARRLLGASTLCAIATVTPSGRAHVNTAYFAWSQSFELVWLSAPEATHSRNLRHGSSAAIAVYGSRQTWGEADRGIQLFGTAREVRAHAIDEASRLYARRFREYDDRDLEAYRLYRFTPRRLKLFDERSLGGGVFVTARVDRGGGLEWERTERYV